VSSEGPGLADASDAQLRPPVLEQTDSASLDWRHFTVVPSKLELFAQEEGTPLARGGSIALEALGDRLPQVLAGVAILVLQPDAIARRQIARSLDFLRDSGFAPLLAFPFRLSVEMARALWRFQFNAITPDSKAIGEVVYCGAPSLMLVLRDDRPVAGVPASTRLTQMKGPSDPRMRGPDHLRSAVGSINKIFGSIHCPDEPIDILRETAIVIEDDDLSRFYHRMGNAFGGDTSSSDLADAIAALHAAVPPHDIDVERATQRLLASTHLARDTARSGAAQRLEHVIRRESTLSWSQFIADVRAVGLDPHGWDSLLVASALVRYDLPATPKIIESFSTPGYG
jgi:hypothetical protein